MSKTITYTSLGVSALLIVFIFLTAKTYTQLAIAVILYPILAYFILKVIPRQNQNAPVITVQLPVRPVQQPQDFRHERVEVADIDRRTFLKFIGGAGISFLVFSILGRRLDSLFFGNAISSGMNSAGSTPGSQTDKAAISMEGYKITEIDEGDTVSYYGFVDQVGGWMVMRSDSETSSFRYAKGNTNFTGNWQNREGLQYDYYYKLF